MSRFISINAVRAIGALAFTLTLSVVSHAQGVALPCCTDFNDSSLHGYGPCVAGGVTTSLRSGGPDGPLDYYLHTFDEQSGPNSSVCVGPDCLGDWTAVALSHGLLCYDVNMFSDGFAGLSHQFHPTVTISNGLGLRATFEVTSPAYITDAEGDNPGWHHICAPIAPLDASGQPPGNNYGHWTMVLGQPGDWVALIANVARISFPVEVGTKHEELGYDNICLSAPCCTDFNDSTLHGYHPCASGGVTITLDAGGPGGATDIYLHGYDQQSPPNSSICAGPDCLGDWTPVAAIGGALCYDVNMFSDGVAGTAAQFHPNVIIAGAGWRATFIVTSPGYITDSDGVNPGWHHICAPIEPLSGSGALPSNSYGHWEMVVGTNAAWPMLIANVTSIGLPIEATTTHETVGYDNVCIGAVVSPSMIPTLSEWGAIIFGALLMASMAFYIWRRRTAVA